MTTRYVIKDRDQDSSYFEKFSGTSVWWSPYSYRRLFEDLDSAKDILAKLKAMGCLAAFVEEEEYEED